MNRAARGFQAGVLSAALLALTAPLGAQEAEHIFPATAETVVEIRNIHGAVKVHGWDQPRVRVVARPHSGAVEAHFEQPASRVHIHTHILEDNTATGARVMDYEVWAPANVHVEVDLKSGSLELENFSEDINIKTVAATVILRNVSGHTSVETLNGSIQAEQCTGHLEVSTISGSLRFTDCPADYLKAGTTSGDIHFIGSLKFAGTYEFSNNEGEIELRLPRTASFELSASSIQGEVVSEFPLKTRAHGRKPRKNFQRSLFGTAQSGGALVRATTFSGTIRIRMQ